MLDIKNTNRTEQIEEFVDKERWEMAGHFYDIYEDILLVNDLERRLEQFIREDPLFFEPYLLLADVLEDEGHLEQADEMRETAFQKAVRRVVNKDGKFPKVIRWTHVENRHIIRAIHKGALLRWKQGKAEEAMEVLRRLLKSNPTDNTGVRYDLLALKMHLGPDYSDLFLSPQEETVDPNQMDGWFNAHSKAFPEEFAWWWEKMADDAA